MHPIGVGSSRFGAAARLLRSSKVAAGKKKSRSSITTASAAACTLWVAGECHPQAGTSESSADDRKIVFHQTVPIAEEVERFLGPLGDPVLVVFTSSPNRVINAVILAIAAGALPGRQQMTKSSA